MTLASLDRVLAILVGAVALTGLLALRSGSAGWAWVFVLHGLASGALFAAIVLKLHRSLPRAIAARRWGRIALALLVTAIAGAALTGGYGWVASGRLLSIGPWTLMSWHAIAGLLLLPLLAVHLVPRRWRLLRPGPRAVQAAGQRLLSRRAILAGAILGAVGVAAYGGSSIADRLMGGERRFTGSRWLPTGGVPPATTFFLDEVPPVDPSTWRLGVHGRVARPASYALEELRALGQADLVAVLDCTSGWALETTWRGVPLANLLEAVGVGPGASHLDVRSATGWGASLTLDQARAALLATGVAGQALPTANGAPCRIVVPDRRGLDWVKWVTEIEVR